MKQTLMISGFSLGLALAAPGAVNFIENFDGSTSIPTGWATTGSVSVVSDPVTTTVEGSTTEFDFARSGTNTLWIESTRDSNSFTTPAINLSGMTEATVSFYWRTDNNNSAFGRFPQINYSSDGSTFANLDQISVPANTSAPTDYALFEFTITTADSYLLTSNSKFQVVGDDNAGGNGAPLIVDDFSVTAIPEPASLLCGGLGMLMLLRRRRG